MDDKSLALPKQDADTVAKKQSFRIILILAVIMLISTAFFIYKTTQKERYHEDEIMTFVLANSAVDGWLHPDMLTPIDANDPFMEAMTVHQKDRFKYDHVWSNQEGDVHPPLYYALIHTISSAFLDTFSPWIGFSINLLFMLLSIVMIYRCAMHLFSNQKTAVAVAAFFAICPAVIDIDMFIRMYMMLMFWCLALLEWILHHYHSERLNVSSVIWLSLIVICGALTHYYFILYLVIFSVTYVIDMWRNCQKTSAVIYSITVLLSGVVSILIFPSMLDHIFSGYRGTEAFGNIFASNNYLYRLYSFWCMIEYNTFSYLGLFTLLACVVILICRRKQLKGMFKREFVKKYLLVAIPTTVFFLFVVKTAAYYEPRYISPIFPCVILLSVIGIYKVIERFLTKKCATLILIALLTVFTVGSNIFGLYTYLLKDGKEALLIAEQYSDYDCAYVFYTDGLWKADCNYEELLRYRSTTFLEETEIAQLDQTTVGNEDSFILLVGYLPTHNYDAAVANVIRSCPNINNSQFLYEWQYTRAYLMTK